MQYRPLGESGLQAGVVGFGAWAIGGWMWGGADEADALRAVETALDLGVNLIDTAPVYGFGRSEELVGRAIRSRRDQVVLATKCGLRWDRPDGRLFFRSDQDNVRPDGPLLVRRCLRPDSIAQEIEASLRRLGTDYLDLYQTHWQDDTTPLEDTLAALHRLRDQGKIRALGVSNVALEHLQRYGPIASAQQRYNLLDRAIEMDGTLAYCREHKIAVLAYSPLAQGLLTGRLTPDRRFGPGDLRRKNPQFSPARRRRVLALLEALAPLARCHGAASSQLIIAWTLAQPGLTHVLCGARRPDQVIENARGGDLSLSPADLRRFDDIAARHLPL